MAAQQGACVICFMICLPGMLSLSDSDAGEACGHLWPEQHPGSRALRDTAAMVTPSPAVQEVSAEGCRALAKENCV